MQSACTAGAGFTTPCNEVSCRANVRLHPFVYMHINSSAHLLLSSFRVTFSVCYCLQLPKAYQQAEIQSNMNFVLNSSLSAQR